MIFRMRDDSNEHIVGKLIKGHFVMNLSEGAYLKAIPLEPDSNVLYYIYNSNQRN